MKSLFTNIRFAVAILASVFMGQQSVAQALIDVTASGGSFASANITINIGDTVRWTNTSGTHNVNGKAATFPGNPDSFGNAVGTGWTYTYVFTIAGSYNYQCDVHAPAMVGTVTVIDPTDIAEESVETAEAISNIYPVPASDHVTIELSQASLASSSKMSLVVYDLMGKEVYRKENVVDAKNRVETEGWSKSFYTFHLLKDSQIIDIGKIVVQ